MFDKSLCPQQLEAVSDEVLDTLITEQAKVHFDEEFYGLGQSLMEAGQADAFMKIESAVTAFSIKVAEAAFAAGHQCGYVSLGLDLTEALRPLGFAA